MSDRMVGVGEIATLAELQEQLNAERRKMTPEERQKDAREALRYIASAEPEYMGWAA